jgi:hypothetical protein
LQGGLNGACAEGVNGIANLELGVAEELVVGLGGEEFGEGTEVLVGGLAEKLVEAFGLGALFGGQVHDGLSRRSFLMRSTCSRG